MAVVSAVMGNAYVLFKKNLNTVIEPPQLWQQGQKRLAVNAWHYLQNGIKPPHLQAESMGTRLRNWSDVSDRKSSFNFSLLLWWKLFFSSLYSLLKRFVLSMCKQMVLEFQACQCSHNAWQCRIVSPSVWKTVFPSWFDQKQSSSTELPGWSFTQGEVSLYFFPACFS